MRRYIILALTVLFSLNLFSTMTVKNLVIEDNPFDDGSGLVVKFQPLPRSARIIEYRVYRGITPDSLFYLGKIDVDPNTGVSGNEVTFFDKDFRPFVDIESPRRLRREKGQKKDSPIFRSLPRDLNIIGPMLSEFSLLAIIDKNNFYYKTKKHIVENEDSRDLLGGLRIEDFEAIVANVIPGKKYYYTVIAVDERRNYHPHAPVQYGIAVDNMPQAPERFFITWVEDTATLKAEFEYPLFVDDIAQSSVYMIEKSKINEYNAYKNYMYQLDDWNLKFSLGDTLSVQPDAVENPGYKLSVIESSFPFTSLNFSNISYEDGFLINPYTEEKIPFNRDNISEYLFYLSFDDYAGFQALSETISAKIVTKEQLPYLPKFEVRDKPYDKGDVNEVIIGRPFASLTVLNFRGRGRNRRKLSVAYSYSPNPNYKIKSINFEFVDNNGNTFATVSEYYLDYLFDLTLPSESLIDEGFEVYITFNAPGTSIHQQKYLSQKIFFDDDLRQLRPGNLFAGDEELLDYRYQILKKSISDKNFRIVSRTTPLMNLFEDNISYEKYIFKGISSYDLKSGHLLFDTSVDLGYDSELETYISTNLYFDDFMEITKEKLSDLDSKLTENPDDEMSQWYKEYYAKILDLQDTHHYLKDINKISGYRSRLSQLIRLREYNRRAFKYVLVKTDNEGLFTISDVFTDENGNQYIFPKPDWFNVKSIPMMVASLIFGFFVFYFYQITRTGKELFIRPIAGLEEIDNAIGRATEMGRPILFVPGLSSIGDVATLAGLSILGHITKKAAEYDTRIIVPVCDYIVLPIAQQIVKEAHYAAGRPDSFNSNDIFFVAEGQFAYVAGVNGVMIRQKTATNFYMGMFFAEALIMTETGNATGAIQVAGTDALTQIPFFITTCDYTLIGEELYAASAYLTRDPMMIGTLKAQDYTKLLIIICVIIGTVLTSFNVTGFINWFPAE